MAGEYKAAAQLVQDAIQKAAEDDSMNADTMIRALMNELLGQLAASHSRQQMDEMIAYQLDNMGEDEFVVTRGC